jgi:hypothetical protein
MYPRTLREQINIANMISLLELKRPAKRQTINLKR